MSRVLKSRLRKAAVVTLKDGGAFRGILFEWDHEALVLRNAAQVDQTVPSGFITADGEIVILIADVAYIQFV